MDVNERNQNKSKVMSHSNWPRVLWFDLAHKQCNSIIKGWFHCLTSESKCRFLVNHILLAWCLVMTKIQFSLIKKTKIGRPEHSLTPHPTHPRKFNNISFSFRHCWIKSCSSDNHYTVAPQAIICSYFVKLLHFYTNVDHLTYFIPLFLLIYTILWYGCILLKKFG